MECTVLTLLSQPGVVKPGTVVDQQWSFWDFLATAVSERHTHTHTQADIAGIPKGSLPINDGYSLLPTLEGKVQDQPRYTAPPPPMQNNRETCVGSHCRYVYHEYCYPNEDKTGWGQADLNWKAVR